MYIGISIHSPHWLQEHEEMSCELYAFSVSYYAALCYSLSSAVDHARKAMGHNNTHYKSLVGEGEQKGCA